MSFKKLSSSNKAYNYSSKNIYFNPNHFHSLNLLDKVGMGNSEYQIRRIRIPNNPNPK